MNQLLSNINFTTLTVIITVIISMLAWQNKAIYNKLIFYPPAVSQGQWYRLLTHGFIHADSMHLLFNMFTLYVFGIELERLYAEMLGSQTVGQFVFIAMYLLAIIAAIIPSYIANKNNNNYLSLGASGGVVAVLFAYILFYPWRSLYVFGILPIPAIILAVLYVAYSIYAHHKGGSKINHLAHLWGGIFGVVATVAIEPNVVIHFLSALLSPRF